MRTIVVTFGLLFLLLGLALENSKVQLLSMEVARLKEMRNREEMEVANLRKKIAELSTLSRLKEISEGVTLLEDPKKGEDTLRTTGGRGIDLASSLDTNDLSGSRPSSLDQSMLFTDPKRWGEVEKTR